MPTSQHAGLVQGREEDSTTSGGEPQLSDSSEETDGSHLGNTEDEIANRQWIKSKKTLKRKRRATEPSHFGATLQSLLDTNAPSGVPLSLKPSVAHQRNEAKLESEARRVIHIERKEREEKGRIRDVIGGWGGESERSLRKVAQRGVVKLFNSIQQSQLATAAAEEEARASRGTGKPLLSAPSLGKTERGRKSNLARMDRQADKDAFFDMIRSGGVVQSGDLLHY